MIWKGRTRGFRRIQREYIMEDGEREDYLMWTLPIPAIMKSKSVSAYSQCTSRRERLRASVVAVGRDVDDDMDLSVEKLCHLSRKLLVLH